MSISKELLREIVEIKHGCSFREIMGHIRYLQTHFDLGQVNEDDIMNLLLELQDEECLFVINCPPYPKLESEICIFLNNTPNKWVVEEWLC